MAAKGWASTRRGYPARGRGRGVPISNAVCDRGNPGTDGDGSGQCYLTDNSSGNNCNSDVDNGTTILTSPTLDASTDPTVKYWRWFSNTFGSTQNQDIFVVEASDNTGATWSTVEIVGPATQNNGGWFQHSFKVSEIVTPTAQFRLRFTAQDTDPQSVVEAGGDGVQLTVIQCDEEVFGDLDGDGIVGINDFLQLLANWGACPSFCPPSCVADLNGDCFVGIDAFLLLPANWPM